MRREPRDLLVHGLKRVVKQGASPRVPLLHCSLTRQAVTRIEAEDSTPSPESMKKLCETLKLPHHFFFRPVRDFPV